MNFGGRHGWLAFLLLAGAIFPCLGAQGEEGMLDVQGVPIHYLVEGRGEPVVLIHGLHGSAATNWGMPGTIKMLAAKHQVIALDLRGHGQSGKPTGEDDYGVKMVEDVVRLLDHLKIEKAHVIGYSLGGMIAMKLATQHPQRVASLILGGMGWLREGSGLQRLWERLPSREGGRTPAACLHGIGALAVTEAEVKAIAVPAAVIVGDNDPCRRMYVASLARLRPDWPVTVIEGAGHLNAIVAEPFKAGLAKQLDANIRKASGGK